MKTVRSVNLIAILVLAVGAAVLGTGVYFLHAYQIRRNIHVLLEQADEAEKSGSAQEAARYLREYLGLKPRDNDALARYGLLQDQLAKTVPQRRKAFEMLEKVLREDKSREDIRWHVTRMAVELNRYHDAHVHLDILKDTAQDNPEWLHLMGRCETGEGNFNEARDFYAQLMEKTSPPVSACMEYAQLLRYRLERAERGDEIVEKMLQSSPGSLPAFLAAARYYRQVGLWADADNAIRVVINDLRATDADVFLLASEIAAGRSNTKEAQGYLAKGLEHHPDDSTLKGALAQLEFQAKRSDAAYKILEPVLDNLPARPEQLLRLGNLLIDLRGLPSGQDKVDRGLENIIDRLAASGQRWAADSLRAQKLLRDGGTWQALALLQRGKGGYPQRRDVTLAIELLISQCYQLLGNPDQELRAAQRALDASPPSLTARRAVAVALLKLGKIDETIAEYQRVVDGMPDAQPDLAALLLTRTRGLPPEKRQWDELERLVGKIKTSSPSTATVLEAEMHVSQGKLDSARLSILTERDRDPKRVQPWLFLISLAEMQDRRDEVLPLIDEAEKQTDRRIEWPLARAGYWLRQGPEKARDELKKLEGDLAFFKGPERDLLLRGLGQAYLDAGDRGSATRLWRELATNQPKNPEVQYQLLELAFRGGQKDDLESALSNLRRLEGPGGPLTAYGEAARLALEARRGNRFALAEARRYLAEAENARPSWSAIPLLQAEMYELERNHGKALEKYKAALERGERRASVIRRVVVLLTEQGAVKKAQALLAGISARARAVTGLDRMDVLLTLVSAEKSNDTPGGRRRALAAARKAVPADSKDFRDYLWLGQVCMAAQENAEAEKAFRKARDLSDKSPPVWTALIFALARTDAKKAEAEMALVKDHLPPETVPLVLAAGYEALGKAKEAEEQYAKAVSLRADNTAVLRVQASFLVRSGQLAKADPLLRKLIDPKTKAPEATATWARHTLAVNMAVGGNHRQFVEAQSLVKESAGETIDDRRVRAIVLAARPESRHEAIRLFESMSSGTMPLSPEMRFILARLYEADGKWTQAKGYLLSLLAEDEKNKTYLAYHAQALLRHQEVEEAEAAVNRLARLNYPSLPLMGLRAQVLRAKKKVDEAVKLVKEYAQEKDAQLDRAALVLDALGATADAEKLFRMFISTSKEPQSVLLMAGHLGRQNRLSEALEICDKAWATCPPETVTRAVVALLRSPQATAEHFQQAEKRITEAMNKQPAVPLFPLALAEMQDNRGRHDEAVATYRKILAQQPRNLIALNNLANVLALRGTAGDEPLQLIQTAVEEAGPNSELLDTRALVYLNRGRPDLAIRDLEQSVAETPRAESYFHLAQAHQKASDMVRAREAFAKAKELELRLTDLHPLERSAWEKMKSELE